ncbi:hypothetical protein BAE44_0006832 [Dichanthelium oligosanthes]|uniref:Uncharacterized protein n=1 Tax=Dichanthelium oligosanthes TaxID=888268 RepID=A0A1E5W485_9POAL|nr:hypothetical protein BAE44_0006832 [Dichanthelium oligosanthes]
MATTLMMLVLLHHKRAASCRKRDSRRPATLRASHVAIHRQHAPADLEQVFGVPVHSPCAQRDGHRPPDPQARIRPCHSRGVPGYSREVLRKNEAVFFSRPAAFASDLFSYGYESTSLTVLEDQWKKMKRVLTSEVLSPALECRLHGQRVLEADHLVRYVYSQLEMTPAGSSCIDNTPCRTALLWQHHPEARLREEVLRGRVTGGHVGGCWPGG